MEVTASSDLDISFLRFLLSKTNDEETHQLVMQMGELAASRLAVYSLGRACLESKNAPPPLSTVLKSLTHVLRGLKRPQRKPSVVRTGRKPIATRWPALDRREAPSTKLAGLTDEEVRREVLQQLLERLEAERANDQTVMVLNRTPFAFSLSRHGNLLTVHRGKDERLIRVELTPRHRSATHDGVEPWSATVRRSANGAKLTLTGGPEGTLNEIVGSIVETFLKRSE